jgi:hypothetical protein
MNVSIFYEERQWQQGHIRREVSHTKPDVSRAIYDTGPSKSVHKSAKAINCVAYDVLFFGAFFPEVRTVSSDFASLM